MGIREDRREAAIDRMTDHVLAEGLPGATLRPLAAAAGTSDRMLLYYFADKEELLTAILERIAARLLADLDSAIPIDPPRPFFELLQQIWEVLGSTGHKAYMNVWHGIVAEAARDVQPHRRVAGQIMDGYLAWVTARLEPEADGLPSRSAPLCIAAIEGMYLLSAIGRPAMVSDAMNVLSATVSRETDAPRSPPRRKAT